MDKDKGEKKKDADDRRQKAGSEKTGKQKRASLGSRLQAKGSLPSMRYC